MTCGATTVNVDTRLKQSLRGACMEANHFLGVSNQGAEVRKRSKKEMHKPRKAARLCFRSGCNKEALVVPYFLAFLLHKVLEIQISYVDISTHYRQSVCHV
jgi:hypothetical protein